MSIVKSEFALALNQVATERGITPDDIIASIEEAVLAAYHKEFPETEGEEGITIKINRDNGESKVYRNKEDITPPGFGRIAAQTAKQVTLQKIREVEKKTVISHYQSQIGNIARGRVIRYDGFNAFVDIGRVEAVLPKEEQIKNEVYGVNVSLVFYIKEISEDKFGNSRVIVSRIDPKLITELFKKEVPEITNGTVEIKNAVREPGERAKIAVFSSQGGVDPVGACVGQRGIRVQTVTNELGGNEKIDIIQWNKDDKLFIIASLSPAKIIEVEILQDEKVPKAKVTVNEIQAPLAIGKGGINVNLASKLTGYEIDIKQVPATDEDKKQYEEEKLQKQAKGQKDHIDETNQKVDEPILKDKTQPEEKAETKEVQEKEPVEQSDTQINESEQTEKTETKIQEKPSLKADEEKQTSEQILPEKEAKEQVLEPQNASEQTQEDKPATPTETQETDEKSE
ncbi:MAG: transcription termination factor NusA [bacterium]